MEKRNIIVIGASTGGFDAIKQLTAGLPANLEAAILIVWHMSPDAYGILPEVINQQQTLPAFHAVDQEPIKMGRIYIAPPDHHLLIYKDSVRITRGPKENRFRPAIDPLFRSAAYAYGPRVIGIILSGALDDGTAGLWAIKENAGMAIVQDPKDAEVPSMPQNALQAVRIDYKVPISEMADLITMLINEPVTESKDLKKNKRTEMEINIAMENGTSKYNILNEESLIPYTCPECHGVLVAIKEGVRMRFRCHTGHAFSTDSLLAAITESIEESLWNAIRSIQESVFLLNHMGDHFAEINQPKLAAMYFNKAREAESHSQIVRKAVLNHEQLSTESLEQQVTPAERNS